jgi:two-component system nitrate/nitrite response regulator NarL
MATDNNREPDRRIRIVIADDHAILRDGLKRLLESDHQFVVVGEATDGMEALEVIGNLRPDLLLLDVAMPRMSGLECLARIDTRQTRVVILTAELSDTAVLRAFQLGARGVVLKQAATRHLLDGIHMVLAGRYLIADDALDDLVMALQRLQDKSAKSPYNLTARELEIIRAIVAGQNNRDIAAELKISTQTVKHHLTSIFDKTGVSTRLELALLALRHQLAAEE